MPGVAEEHLNQLIEEYQAEAETRASKTPKGA
jgi:hypothetical protein